MPTAIWRHVFPRLNLSDFAGVVLVIALVLVALYCLSDRAGSDDDGIQQHYAGHLFRIRYGAAH
jgi:hypothetical protein